MEITQGVIDLYESGLKALFKEAQEATGLTAMQVWTRLRLGAERWDEVCEEDFNIIYDVVFHNRTMSFQEATRLGEKYMSITPLLTTLGEIKDGTFKIDPQECVCRIPERDKSKGV